MGKLRNKVAVQTRIWLDPDAKPIPDLDYDFAYPITSFDEVKKTKQDGSSNLIDEFDAVDKKLSRKQDIIPPGNPNNLMKWTNVEGTISSVPIKKYIESDPDNRTHDAIPTEKAIGDLCDTKASANEFESHINDVLRHINDGERELWNNMTPMELFNLHLSDDDSHLREGERDDWNSKAYNVDLERHVNDVNNPHKVTASQINTYTRPQIDELIESVQTTFFNYMNIIWNESTGEVALVKYNENNWNPNYILEFNPQVMPDVPDQGGTYFALLPATNYLSEESNDVIIMVKVPGIIWREIGRQTIKNGDLFIRYPDTAMYLWIAGHFIEILTR